MTFREFSFSKRHSEVIVSIEDIQKVIPSKRHSRDFLVPVDTVKGFSLVKNFKRISTPLEGPFTAEDP